jgi:phosphate-selective porin OprO/OprP
MRCSLRTILAAAVAALGFASCGLSFGQGEGRPADYAAEQSPAPTWEDYRELAQRLQETEQRLQTLGGQVSTMQADPYPRVLADGNPQVPAAEQRLTALENTVGKKEGPKYPNARLSGFFHLDAGYFHQDAANRAQLGDIQDGVGFRRARLQALGSVSEFTNYSLEMDFGTAGRPSFLDVWGEQTHLPIFGNLRVGQFRQPTSMDSLTSVRQLEFLERSLPFQALDPFRRVGIMAYDKSEDELWTWAYSGYKTGGFNNAPLGDSRYATDIGDVGGYAAAGRLTHLLWYDEPAEGRYLLHVGGSYSYNRTTGSTTTAPFYEARAIPEFFVGDPAGGNLTANGTPTVVDTGRLFANQFHFFNAQLAGQYGAAHFQAEYMATLVDQIGNPNVYYDGAYVQGGYFLTGEHRTYNRMFGTFDKVVPFSDFFALGRKDYVCGWGAWELTGRWSYVNLSDPAAAPIPPFGAGPPPVVNPGRANDTTVGLNWFWNSYTVMQFNWIHCFLDNTAAGNSDLDIFCARFQLGF